MLGMKDTKKRKNIISILSTAIKNKKLVTTYTQLPTIR